MLHERDDACEKRVARGVVLAVAWFRDGKHIYTGENSLIATNLAFSAALKTRRVIAFFF